jgi:hypothetical protein
VISAVSFVDPQLAQLVVLRDDDFDVVAACAFVVGVLVAVLGRVTPSKASHIFFLR